MSHTKCGRHQQFQQIMHIPQALRLAIDEGEVIAIEQELDDLGVLSEQDLDNAFTYAIRNASADTVGVLLRHGAHLKRTSLSRFELRNRGDPTIYQKLIEHGWDINSTEFGAPWLWYVVAYIQFGPDILKPSSRSGIWDNERLLRWFLDHGADPNKPNRSLPNSANNEILTPLAFAAEAPETFGLEILLSYGANMDDDAIFRAIAARSHPEKSHVPHIRILVNHGADVNHRSRRWGTPLQYAIHAGRADIVEFLLDQGADPTTETVRGTPAEHAKNKGRMDIHDMIVKAIQRGHST
ncbi:uncharacterized protein N0V89_000071 [Didymosphaeria variabile]|uniref:Ankyrin n=1 Tax=Didymosphaeria variabile TaxID=1932322 RepID=A0A9W8XUL9_9PLEO|nr:uncharacterized protein N0V89_000071 [Didymosphaeria variabile]KAJ4359516.1 hypothetical protein N0V89_000071 [Didymosphaeria variabile]